MTSCGSRTGTPTGPPKRGRPALGTPAPFQHPEFKDKATTTKEDKVAQTMEATKRYLASNAKKDGVTVTPRDRSFVDLMISWAGAVVALALVALGAAAIFGGSFALSNVRDRLEPQNISFPPAAAMSPEL